MVKTIVNTQQQVIKALDTIRIASHIAAVDDFRIGDVQDAVVVSVKQIPLQRARDGSAKLQVYTYSVVPVGQSQGPFVFLVVR